MTSKSIIHRLANIERRMKKVLWPLVLFYRESEGLSATQQSRISDAKAEGRPVRLIKTCIIGNESFNG